MGIDLHSIDAEIQYQNKTIIEKVIQALMDFVTENSSAQEASDLLLSTLDLLEEKHEILQHLDIQPPQQNSEIPTITINPNINKIEPYKLGSALRDIIRVFQEHLDDRSFIEEFKKNLGDDYLNHIEKLGVNLFFFELKYK